MTNTTTIFKSAKILLPKEGTDLVKWAVVACDQFTSEPAYWAKCEEIIGDAPSAYNFILPEAYLETEKEALHGKKITESMNAFSEADMKPFDGILYIERTLPGGTVRHGMVGKIDLEAYDYSVGSTSPVRATEATVLERIPPRCKVRSEAVVELPHILILIDDKQNIIGGLGAKKSSLSPLYDFELMQGGGRIAGWGVEGEALNELLSNIAAYEDSTSGVVYAMGDGNHSLAAAKAHYENVKAALGEAAKEHPARYALCEITALGDDSLVFEPIYRVMMNCDPDDVAAELGKITAAGKGAQEITLVAGEKEEALHFPTPSHALTVGTLQNFIDDYIKAHPGVKCDYIHGENTTRELARAAGTVGFVFDGMDKSELFPYVEAHGALPRKTFSMGEAESKRYYLEMRKIVTD
ncbi:MAG: DUF1015 domain-containing protein [Ruminococcaceae bacterium]|nr:DUF1015 domain-containing protein [Oscillospiraceae bacterium]